jgi:predicted nucleic acid-binding protein
VTEFKAFLDSSVWLGYFLGNLPEAKGIVENEESMLFTSIISIHEIVKRLKKLGKAEKEIENAVRFIEDNSTVVNLSREIAINAVNECIKFSLHAIDGLIYTSAMAMEAVFITADYDFKQCQKTRIIEAK